MQETSPMAMIQGQPLYDCPQDLYIPPEALQVFLDQFEGPLDLLLYLIRKNNIDILDIPIASITQQYLGYIEAMQNMHWDLASEYLFMAAWLAEIKSKFLLPKPKIEAEGEQDPRAELAKRLLEYEQFKTAAENIDLLPRVERDVFPIVMAIELQTQAKILPKVELSDLIQAMQNVYQRLAIIEQHHITMEPISVANRMQEILALLKTQKFINVYDIFNPEEGKIGFIINVLAMLELAKETLIEISQTHAFAPVYISIHEN